MTNRDDLLNDIFFRVDIQEQLAKKYGKSSSNVSQIAKALRQLESPPTTKNNRLVCSNCQKSETNLKFYRNHKTNQILALVCQPCLLKLGRPEIKSRPKQSKTVPIEHFKQLYDIMINKMTPKEKLTAEEMEFLMERGEELKVE